MSRREHAACRGNSLLEVMLAVALMAVTVLGLTATQWWTAGEAKAVTLREHAAMISDAVAETARANVPEDTALSQWKVLAARLFPQGEVSIRDQRAGAAVAQVTWLPPAPSVRGEVIDMPESCGGMAVPPRTACVAIAFTR
ncbi:type IV pilus modification PilV family protein [Paraburkholderia megapolitana]|uniref:Prepilin-type N-terminal cleavage/methylation domain-containing protein n=1 Tax=Paraburkholderia megapolitana TaxID=420953 RepID=A0A1I3GEU1_9BURK|nr:hypothetical protein [Paraburkholderia megapolitana]QDQ82864.1 hypothetical protein FNZ07_16620 [Paraburkholderia megapolitana]SFI21691.1 hypothetical protein SAMN05192543_102476 [Paraburkholderia megapolitana]